jgi:hypothetical protein
MAIAVINNRFSSLPKGGNSTTLLSMRMWFPVIAVLFALLNAVFWIPALQLSRENILLSSYTHYNQNEGGVIPKYLTKTKFIDDTATLDVYSAAWWQSVERFMECKLDEIRTLEDATFQPVFNAGHGQHDVAMTVDYMDFSVEHMSKWFKWPDSNNALSYAIGRMQFATEQISKGPPKSTFMETTLAVMPLAANSKNPVHLRTLQETLAATIASLLQQGIGRVVVAGYFENDAILTRNAFLQLQMIFGQQESIAEEVMDSTLPFEVDLKRQIGHGDEARTIVQHLAFVHCADADPSLVPKAALKGLHQALRGKVDANGQMPETWLGPPLPRAETFRKGTRYPWSAWSWDYIYFTEPDQILNARLTKSFLKSLDRGEIVLPHRLQPLPHISDLVGLTDHYPAPISKFIVSLDNSEDACCDLGPQSSTGSVEAGKAQCAPFWWECHYEEGAEHMQDYELIRVTTGVVHVAATEHSRKCRPVKGGRGSCVDVTLSRSK